jgi:hypothetical protein
MSKKVFVPPRLAPLQRVIAEPITDRAEQAALDKLREHQKRKPRGRQAKVNRNSAKAASRSATKKRP